MDASVDSSRLTVSTVPSHPKSWAAMTDSK